MLAEKLQEKVRAWREDGYPCPDHPVIGEILRHSKDEQGHLVYLRTAQFNALETYWYIRLVLGTPRLLDLYEQVFDRRSEIRREFGISNTDVVEDMVEDGGNLYDKIKSDPGFARTLNADTLHESLNLEYPSYILALAMGAGKTVLIGTIIATEFSMAMEYPGGKFMQNALVFAPGTTIIESLRELLDIPFEKILPRRFYTQFKANIKVIYTRKDEKEIQAQAKSTYNLIVTNTEKIMLKEPKKSGLAFERKTLLANQRLVKIASLPKLGIFSDEAHHTYGNALGKKLKKVRSTINHLHEETDIICVVNTTGTPYYKKQIIKDVVFWYSLQQGIRDNILKSVHNGIVAYDFNDSATSTTKKVIDNIIKDFFDRYKEVKLPNGAKAKIAFYFTGQERLEESKRYIENALAKNGQPITLILVNTKESSRQEVEEFNNLNDATNQKRIILLVNKGTEGWNCPSLFATALVRKLSSSNNFVLQAAARCLRQVPGNKTRARVYLEAQNQKILDTELQNTSGIGLTGLGGTDTKMETQILLIKKEEYPPLKIIRKVQKTVNHKTEQQDIYLTMSQALKVAEDPDHQIYESTFNPNLSTDALILQPTGEEAKIIFASTTVDLYTATLKIAHNYHLDYLDMLKKIEMLYSEKAMPRHHLQELFQQVEGQTQNYKVITEEIIEVLAIIKFHDENGQEVFEKNSDDVYCHTIRYKPGFFGDNNERLVHQKNVASQEHQMGFHYTPYNFDSNPEKEFFATMLSKLNLQQESIEDIYFTGGLTATKYTDMYFQYKGMDGRYHNYFPDFVIVKKDNSFLIVEIKAEGGQHNPEVQAKAKAVKELVGVDGSRFQYEVIYTNAPIPVAKFQSIEKWLNNGNKAKQ